MPESVRTSALARTVIELARRLGDDPADSIAVLLARELRMAMGELRRLSQVDVGGDLDAWLRGISAPSLGDGSH